MILGEEVGRAFAHPQIVSLFYLRSGPIQHLLQRL
jgi:hypothetical protein